MSAQGDIPRPRTPAVEVFVVGPGRSGTALLYKLLCLHPEVAYVSNLERRLPWLPASASGRLRLRRYSSKLRHWFQGTDHHLARGPRLLLNRLVPAPADAEALCLRRPFATDTVPARTMDARTMAGMRSRLAELRTASGASVLACKLGLSSHRLPLIDAVFPGARYISVERDGREVAASLARLEGWNQRPLWWDPAHRSPAQAVAEGEELMQICARNWRLETAEISRGLARIPPSRVLTIRYEALVASPVEQMRTVMDFLGVERRMDYEWALKALELGRGCGARRTPWDDARLDRVFREQEQKSSSPECAS